jgi:hypothetical protein
MGKSVKLKKAKTLEAVKHRPRHNCSLGALDGRKSRRLWLMSQPPVNMIWIANLNHMAMTKGTSLATYFVVVSRLAKAAADSITKTIPASWL